MLLVLSFHRAPIGIFTNWVHFYPTHLSVYAWAYSRFLMTKYHSFEQKYICIQNRNECILHLRSGFISSDDDDGATATTIAAVDDDADSSKRW